MDTVVRIRKSFLVEFGAATSGFILALAALILFSIPGFWTVIAITILLGFIVLLEVVGLRTAGPWFWWVKIISFELAFLAAIFSLLNATSLFITPFLIGPPIFTVLVIVAVLDAGLILVNAVKFIILLSDATSIRI